MKILLCRPVVIILFGMFFSSNVMANPSTSYEGYELFNKYCSICHGEGGKGNGLLAKKIEKPPADLTNNKILSKRTDEDLIRIVEGTLPHGTKASDMPNWRYVLPGSQIRSLVVYIRFLHRGKNSLPGDPGLGKKVYDNYCTQCHGTYGKGHGILTKVYTMDPVDHSDAARMDKIKNKKLRSIITDGGKDSSLMPGWGGVLTKDEIDAVISYIRLIAAH